MQKRNQNGFTLRLAVLVAVFSAATVVAGPRSAPEKVTDDDIARYQAAMEKGCNDEGHRKGANPESTARFCGCVIAGFKAALSHEQWQQAVFAAQHHDEKEEARIMWSAGKPACQKDP